MMNQSVKKTAILGALIFAILPGCATTNNLPEPEHFTAIEQFLLTQAVEFSLNAKDVPPLSFPQGETMTLETTGLTVEQRFLLGAVGRWLGEQGFRIQPKDQNPAYRGQILIQAFGTEQSQSFFGMPEVQGGLLPFAIPELAVYKAQYQKGYSRFRLDFFETETGKFVRSTPWFQASTYYNEYEVLFFINFHTTNLIGPFEETVPPSTNDDHAAH